ncbi:MAG: YbjN domain-containing protein [Parvularculaceae bacterium]
MDVIESFASDAGIMAERVDANEVHLSFDGGWKDLTLWFAWRHEFQTIQIGATLDLKVEPDRMDSATRLLALVNERLWIGHFDLWSDDGSIVFRHGVVLSEEGDLDRDQVEILIQSAIDAYERFYPAFDFVLWSDRTPDEALDAAMFDTVGNA